MENYNRLYVMLWPNGRMVSVRHGAEPSLEETPYFKDALSYQDINEAKATASEYGWDIGVYEARYLGKTKTRKV